MKIYINVSTWCDEVKSLLKVLLYFIFQEEIFSPNVCAIHKGNKGIDIMQNRYLGNFGEHTFVIEWKNRV